MMTRPWIPKRRISALLLDWSIWAYISYCVFFLINHLYESLIALSVHDRLDFPAYGWWAAIFGSLTVALIWESFGTSLGQKAQGIVLLRADRAPATALQRLQRAPADLLGWLMTLAAVGLIAAPIVSLGTLIHGAVYRSMISLIPSLPLWTLQDAPWHTVLIGVLASAAGLALIGLPLWWISTRWLRWIWGDGSDRRSSLADRLSGTSFRSTDDVDPQYLKPKRWFRTSAGLMTFVLIAMTLCVGWLLVDIDINNLVRRAPFMRRTLTRLTDPDFSTYFVTDPVLRDTVTGAMLETIYMALMATLVGFVFAFPLSFLGARNLMGKGPIGWMIYTLTRAFFNIFRSIETLIWAIIFAVWVSFGPFAGVLALAVHTVAALGKLYSEQVESIDPGPVEAMTAAGARRWQIIAYGVIPQIIPSFLAFTMYRWDINVRMSTVIGLVGGGGIGRMLFHYKNDLHWEKVGAVIVMIVAVVWSMDYISARVRERIT